MCRWVRKGLDGGRRRLTRFGAETEGFQSLEMLVWTVFFLQLSTLAIDVTMLYGRHAEMWTVARDAVRQTAMGALEADTASVQAFVQDRLDASYTASLSEVPGQTYTVTITASLDGLEFVPILDFVAEEMAARVTMVQEAQ